MKALTIHPIWLHMITRPAARGFSPKRVENRTDRNGNAGQPCHHRGPLLLHASAKQARREYDDVLRFRLRFAILPPIVAPIRAGRWLGRPRR